MYRVRWGVRVCTQNTCELCHVAKSRNLQLTRTHRLSNWLESKRGPDTVCSSKPSCRSTYWRVSGCNSCRLGWIAFHLICLMWIIVVLRHSRPGQNIKCFFRFYTDIQTCWYTAFLCKIHFTRQSKHDKIVTYWCVLMHQG